MDPHPYSAAALGPDAPKRRPSLASPLPPTPVVPSTPLPKAKPSVANHMHHQPPFQQRPSTAPSTSSSNLSDPPSTRGMMKRLLAKPAPPSSPSAPFSSLSMRPGFQHANTNEDDDEKHPQDQDPVQEITISSSPLTDALLTPRSITNEFDKSIRALDLVGQIDISMAPRTTSLDFVTEPPGSTKKQRNVFRRRPSGTATTTPSVPTSPSSEYPIGFGSVDDSTSSTPTPTTTPTPSTTTPIIPLLRPRPRRSSSSPTRHPTQKRSSASNRSSPGQPKATHSHTTKPNKIEQSSVTPYYTVLGDNPRTIVAAGGPEDLFWDTCGEYWDKKEEQRDEDGGAASTRTLSGKLRKNDSDRQSRPKPSVHEHKRSSSVDKDPGTVKQSRDVPAGNSPSKRFWKLVKKISVNGLREKNQLDSDHPPPVPPLPSDLTNDPFHQHRVQNDCSLVENGNQAISTSTLASSPTTALDNLVYKTALVPSTPSTSAQHHSKLPPSAPHSPPTQPASGPRQSTTTRSSSPSSDVASSQFFNRQSARSSTSSFGEELMPPPPLPKTSIKTTANGKTNANETNANRKLQQHIIRPSDLSRHHSKSNINLIAMPMPIQQPPPFMEDDWTIVRSPSVELEPLSLPPPPRQLFKGAGIGLDRRKTTGSRGSKAKTGASDLIPNMSKMVNTSSEQVNEKSRDVSNNARSQEDDRNIIKETTKSEHGDKGKDVLESNTDRDSNRSQSPTIPSFSTSSAINSFPARRISSSLSTGSKGSPIAPSPDTSNRSSRSAFSTANVLRSPSRSPQRPGSRTALGRVRQHLFGTNDVYGKAEEAKESEEVLNPLPSSSKSDIQIAHLRQLHSLRHPPPQQQERQTKTGKHHRHSSGSTGAKSKSTHAVSPSSVSTPASPIITSPHKRSMSFNTSPSSALPTQGLITSASSSPGSNAPQVSSAIPTPHITPLPPSPSLTARTGHRTRSSSNLRSGFSGRKLSEVLFSPSSSTSSPGLGSAAYRVRPSSSSSHRTKSTFMSRTITVGASNRSKPDTPNPVTPSQPLTQLTDQEKADKWNDLLARSARAGGTLHLAAGSRLLGSDDI